MNLKDHKWTLRKDQKIHIIKDEIVYSEQYVKDAVIEFQEKLQNSPYCKCGFNKYCYLCKKLKEIFGDFEDEE